MSQGEANQESEQRRVRWMAALAKASLHELEEAWRDLPLKPGYEFLRRPETGLAMIQGRAGGTGRRFNLGEMTITRCVVQSGGSFTGYSYLAGRDHRRAELAAVFDALLQDPKRSKKLWQQIVEPLETAQARRRAEIRAQSAPTKVDFFTMVRGDE